MKIHFSRRSMIAACAASVLPVLLTATSGFAQSGEVRLRTNLSGSAIGRLVPSGHAEFRSRPGRMSFNVQVEDVNFPAGTVLQVFADGNLAGTITISGAPDRGGELELNTQDGQPVPALSKGDLIQVKHGARNILAGVL